MLHMGGCGFKKSSSVLNMSGSGREWLKMRVSGLKISGSGWE